MKEYEAFKVIHGPTRLGSNAGIFLSRNSIQEFRDTLNTYPSLREYFPLYNKDRIVKEIPGTCGIFCFETYEYAEAFIRRLSASKLKVIKVVGYCKRKREVGIVSGAGKIINLISSVRSAPCPQGTIRFRKVKVIE